ncbi:MAG: hypothetical protein BWY09_01875 [Candidatus Hydrogenedentes bacterium ADurb.Bin179]|nr:MAG: hypothetical protein BWY09_01875 [Candidatus Hydrogenedentes bacterium ADurb.Bin179]
MERFIIKHQDKITGIISCFDRIMFKGYLPVSSPEGMEGFLNRHGILFKDFKRFASTCSEGLKIYAQDVARSANRPFQYIYSSIRKEECAREIALRDGITQGLVCVFSIVEACHSFKLKYGAGKPRLAASRPRCLCLYYYYMDKEFGLMHVRLQTWFPFTIQIYINGHEWLSRKMMRHGIAYTQVENAFIQIEDCKRAQRFADKFVRTNFPRILEAIARKINPLFNDLLKDMHYYWVIDQAEYATDILFKDRASLKCLYEKLLRHATVCFSAEDVMTFLGRKLNGNFQGEVANELKKRWPGARVKHRMKGNWIKMYDKHGCVLRIETVINHPYEFRVRREGKRRGLWTMAWYPMAKRVSNLYRYAEVCYSANHAYIEALSVIDDPAKTYRTLHQLCVPVTRNGRQIRGLNPMRKDDLQLFSAALRGENFIHGFRNNDIARYLNLPARQDPVERKRQSARVTRLIHLLHAHGLIAKIPRTRRYRLTLRGATFMAAAVYLYNEDFPNMVFNNAA